MQLPDFIVLIVYFSGMIVIGALCSRMIKKQDDYFMGGRGFGKLLQTFAAFGAGTAAHDPINVGRTTWTSGLSGVWSALMWLFVTPVYWIVGVWYRRMRHTTLGDWFVERYESPAMGATYAVCALSFVIFYLSAMFSAISKVAAPLLGEEAVLMLVGLMGSQDPNDLKYLLVPLIAVIVMAYGVAGGLAAAYWTDLIQGICIIVLSIILIPYALSGLVEQFGDPANMGLMDGFRIMHERVASENFQLFGGPRSGEFPFHYIVSLSLLGLVGVVVQPHFIATGGGTAKDETVARIGLVTGNFLKRLCTIGWALTGLVVLALLADSAEIAADPDRAWGVATREILGKVTIGGYRIGLVGLMLACLLAALMSTADCFMVIMAALLVRNVYVAFIRPDASDVACIRLGRIAGLLVIAGATVFSVSFYDVFRQYTLALEIPILMAAPFWIGMYWRRATRGAAWGTMLFSLILFFLVPIFAPIFFPALRGSSRLVAVTDVVTTRTVRAATASDVAKREAVISLAKQNSTGQELPPLIIGDRYEDSFTTGGKPLYWTGSVQGELVEVDRTESDDGSTVRVVQRYRNVTECSGLFQADLLIYSAFGMDLQQASNALLKTLRLPTRLVLPFVVMMLLSLLTRPGTPEVLDRYYAKMKTSVDADEDRDRRKLEEAFQDLQQFEKMKLFPGTNWEFSRPSFFDVAGFLVCVAICCLLLWLLYWLANIGAS